MKRFFFRHTILLVIILLLVVALCACDRPIIGEETIPVVTIDFAGLPTKESYVPCTVSVVDHQGIRTIRSVKAEIRLRGHSTLSFDKKPYRVKFDRKTSFLDLGSGPSKSWVLLAEYVDQSLLRNYTTYRLAERILRDSFSTDAAHVSVTINGVDQGVYLLAEQTQTTRHRIDLDESGIDDPGILDTGYLLELESDQSRRDEEGTYMLDWFDIPEYTNNDVVYGWWNMHEHFLSPDASYYVIKSDAKSAEQIEFIRNYLKDAYDRIYRLRSEEAVASAVVIDSAVDMYILQLLTNDFDHNYSSSFLYKDKGSRIIFGPPWDYDLAFGNHAWNEDPDTIHVHHLLYELSRQSWFRALVRDRWNDLKDEDLFSTVEEEIRVTYAKYEETFQKNEDLWKDTRTDEDWHEIYRTFDSPKEAMEQMLEFIDLRIEFIDEQIESWT
ncbi:MAG: CotH kinase family protein [Acholeplasmataceae bacterium]